MLTRRDAIRVALGISVATSALPAWAFAAKEFWEAKPASEWTSEEVDRLLTKSPWAKEAVVSYNGGGGDFGDGDNSPSWPRGQGGGGGIGGGGIGGGGIGGGIPGIGGIGGIGGRRGGGTPGGDPRGGASDRRQFRGTVRWESARPIQEALRIGSSEDGTNSDFEKYYVINLLGDLPTMGSGRRRGDNSSTGDDPARKERRIERLKDVTRLEHKDGPLLLEKVEQGSRIGRPGPGTLFYFSRLDGISLDDKQVTFITKLGPVEVRTKFTPKDMLYRGKLAI